MTATAQLSDIGRPGLRDAPTFWPLMPGERLEWVGRPCLFDRRAWWRLARRIAIAVLVAFGGTMAARAGLFLFWPIRNRMTNGDLSPLSVWLSPLPVLAAVLLALAVAVILLVWLFDQARLSRTRYAITDRRVIELCRRSFGTAIRCLSLAAADPRDSPDRDGNLVVGVSPSAGWAATGSLITVERLVLRALGPALDAALTTLKAQRQRRHDDTGRTDAAAEDGVWSGWAIDRTIWDQELFGEVVGVLFLLLFVLVGLAMMIGGIAALFGYPTVWTFDGAEHPSPIGTVLFGTVWLGMCGTGFVATLGDLLEHVRNRKSRRFRVARQEAVVVPDSPFGAATSCPISPDMRIDLWLGRQPHLRFVDRVDESEGSKSLTRVGFDGPADPMGAYMALVAAREAAVLRHRVRTGTT